MSVINDHSKLPMRMWKLLGGTDCLPHIFHPRPFLTLNPEAMAQSNRPIAPPLWLGKCLYCKAFENWIWSSSVVNGWLCGDLKINQEARASKTSWKVEGLQVTKVSGQRLLSCLMEVIRDSQIVRNVTEFLCCALLNSSGASTMNTIGLQCSKQKGERRLVGSAFSWGLG